MRIILATPIYPPEVGGPATYVVEIAERLKHHHKIVVVAYGEAREPVAGTTLVSVSKKQNLPLRLFRYTLALKRAAKTADLIYVQNAVAAGIPAIVVGAWLRKPVIVKFVGDEAWERATHAHKTTKQLEDFLKSPEGGVRTKILIGIQRLVLKRAALVTTPSAYLLELLATHYGVVKEKGFVNYNAAEEQESVDSTPYIGHQISVASRLVPWKHIDGIIQATVELRKKFPDVRLMVAGDGPEKKSLESLVHALGAESSVSFLGRISQKDARALQHRSAVHVLNSSYEGLPHEVLNSFAMQTPVVATNIPGTNEVVYHEQSGLLVPVGDDTALAAAIERIFTDSALRERLVEGGTKILKDKFSWALHLERLEEMFKKVAPVEKKALR